jgi:hypothetical protein
VLFPTKREYFFTPHNSLIQPMPPWTTFVFSLTPVLCTTVFGPSATSNGQFYRPKKFHHRPVQLLPFLPLLLFSNASYAVHCDDFRCSFPDPTVTWESFSRVTCFLMFGPVSLLFIIFLPFSRSAPFFLLLLLLLSSGKAGDKNPLPHPYDHLADF